MHVIAGGDVGVGLDGNCDGSYVRSDVTKIYAAACTTFCIGGDVVDILRNAQLRSR
jgi:hypothetical protein